jgi:hypothetical protein
MYHPPLLSGSYVDHAAPGPDFTLVDRLRCHSDRFPHRPVACKRVKALPTQEFHRLGATAKLWDDQLRHTQILYSTLWYSDAELRYFARLGEGWKTDLEGGRVAHGAWPLVRGRASRQLDPLGFEEHFCILPRDQSNQTLRESWERFVGGRDFRVARTSARRDDRFPRPRCSVAPVRPPDPEGPPGTR